jgi:aldehyde dehydrogenase (NAD+)
VATKTYQNFIGGEWFAAKSGKTFQNQNPADTREIVAGYPASGSDEARAAIDAATAGTTPLAATKRGPRSMPQPRHSRRGRR